MSIAHLVALSHFYKIGPVSYQRLVAQFASIERAWTASLEDLALCLPENLAREFVAWRTTVDPQELLDDALRRDMTLVAFDDPAYPVLLKTIHDPPFLLYVRGTLPSADAVCVGVVGSRKATEYGLRAAHDLSRDLARRVVVVSGLAWGIDEAAHQGTLDAGGMTIAVLASGLDGGDSSRKQQLAHTIIAQGGAIISEFAPEVPPLTHHFPIRNRIVAGMSKGVLVVEAAHKSGSLITARAAIAENRDVFAVPGSIFSETSQGTNALCRDGAHVVTSANDVLGVLGFADQAPSDSPITGGEPLNISSPAMGRHGGAVPNLSGDAATIFASLTTEPLHIDDIVRAASLPAATVLSTLTTLEIEGHVRHLGGMRYIR